MGLRTHREPEMAAVTPSVTREGSAPDPLCPKLLILWRVRDRGGLLLIPGVSFRLTTTVTFTRLTNACPHARCTMSKNSSDLKTRAQVIVGTARRSRTQAGPAWRQSATICTHRDPDYESGGRRFESFRARQRLIEVDSEFLIDFFGLDIAACRGSTGATRGSIWTLCGRACARGTVSFADANVPPAG